MHPTIHTHTPKHAIAHNHGFTHLDLVSHICVANPFISLIGPGGDLQNSVRPRWVNSSLPGQNGRLFPDRIFKCTFMNWKFCISIWIRPKFVPKGPIEQITQFLVALVLVMVWHRSGDKPLPEPMLTHFIDAYMHHSGEMRHNSIAKRHNSITNHCVSNGVMSLIH